MEIALRLKAERSRRGLTIPALAGLVGVHPQTLRNYESGTRMPPADVLTALARAGLDVIYILTGTTAKRMAIEQIDWAALNDIAMETEKLCALNDAPVSASMRTAIIKKAYGQYEESREWAEIGRPAEASDDVTEIQKAG